MAHEDLRVLATFVLLASTGWGCGGGPSPAPQPPAPVSPAPSPTFSESAAGIPHFTSKRFHLTLPLPDGRAWRIDDHSRDQLVATHEATRSTLVIELSAETDLMSRQKCEIEARARKLVPSGELQTVEDVVSIAPETFDTRVWVAIEPGANKERPVTGHVLAFGGFLRKCLFFHYSTEVASAAEEEVLSSRLAVARARIFGGLAIDPFAEVSRQRR